MGSNRQPRVDELCSAAAKDALAEWSARSGGSAHALRLAEFLRERFEPELARALAEQHTLRLRAAAKFQPLESMLLHRKGLEQATRLDVASWRARRIAQFAPRGPVVDGTCGLGADAIALARAGLSAVALELDERTAQFAAHNLREAAGRECVVLASADSPPVLAEYWCLDPDRRDGEKPSLDPRGWSPALADVYALAQTARAACLKLAPGFDLEQHGPAQDHGMHWRATWVSAGGELRECSLWSGEWAGEMRPGEREAVLLGRSDTPSAEFSLCEVPHREPACEIEQARAVRWLAEPDPAVIRSGLIGNLARRVGARPLAAQLAYLGSETSIEHPMLDAWPVLDCCPLDRKHVRRMLAAHDIGPIQVRKRGHSDTAELLARRFAGPGSQRGHLAVARLEAGHVAYLLG
jgi:hypothetical protein